MKHIPLLLLVASVAISVAARQESSDERRVRQLDNEFVHAAIKKNLAAFERLAAPDFAQISLDGHLQTKARIIENWPWLTNANVLDRVDRIILTGDVAIVTGEHDGNNAGSVAFMRVWQKRNGQWLAVASQHSTTVASAPEAARVTNDIPGESAVMQVAEPLAPDAQAVFDAYRLVREAVHRGDRRALDRLTLDDCLFGRFGVVRPKRAVIDALDPRLPPPLEADIRVRLHGEAAVLTARRVLETDTRPSLSGHKRQSMATVVFVRRGHGWELAAAHETLTIQR